jgi:hypothetical protein
LIAAVTQLAENLLHRAILGIVLTANHVTFHDKHYRVMRFGADRQDW